MFASGVMITAFAKDANERTANIFVKTEANIMINWIDSGQPRDFRDKFDREFQVSVRMDYEIVFCFVCFGYATVENNAET